MAFHPPGGGGSPSEIEVPVPVTGGTTNGIFYQNGSDEMTNGSSLTWDGSVFTAAGVTISASGVFPDANDGGALGSTLLQWSDLFLAEGGVINWDNGDATITQTNNVMAFAGLSDVTMDAVLRPAANDGGTLGSATVSWADLFLASGAVVNFANGDVVMTHSAGILTMGTGEMRITTPGTNSASVVTVGGTQTLTAKTLTAATLEGATNIDGTPAADDTFNGFSTNAFNAGATVAQWEAVYLDSSSTWQLTDADAAATAGSVMIAIATEAGTNTNPMRVALPGTFCRNDAWNWTVGGTIYLSTTPGALTQTAPSATDDVVRVCGWAVNADTIFWNPSPDYITIV